MDDQKNMLVFEKKEVVILFLLLIISLATAFTLGVRLGRKWDLNTKGFTNSDMDEIALQSVKEEAAKEVLTAKENLEIKNKDSSTTKDLNVDAFTKLKKEFETLEDDSPKTKDPAKKIEDNNPAKADTRELLDSYKISTAPLDVKVDDNIEIDKDPVTSDVTPGDANYIGKYTVQVGSYKKIDDAKKFASGFEIRGYAPVINEVKLRNKGVWYRVGIGIFDNVKSAKAYINKKRDLFQSYDYIVTQIK
jgi:cell division protein FtsN